MTGIPKGLWFPVPWMPDSYAILLHFADPLEGRVAVLDTRSVPECPRWSTATATPSGVIAHEWSYN